MAKARKVKQLSFEMPDRPGLLTEITASFTNAKVNIIAICAYEWDKRAYFMMIVDSNAKAKKTLSKMKIKPDEEDVLAVDMPNTVGALQKVAKKISDVGVNIYYMYGTASTGKSSMCIFSTSNDSKALKAIK